MSISFTNHTLEKLEQLLKEVGFKVRYEKGNFKTGSCLIESSKIIVVNKFSNLKSKIISLIELIKNIDVDISNIGEKQKAFYYSLKQTQITF
jgi:signal recognition particle subunit SEC65